MKPSTPCSPPATPPSLSDEQIANILKGITIPPQPQILLDLQLEQAAPEPDLQAISALISRDVGLGGSVLKVVNSPFFGLRCRIISIEQAVSLIGLDGVINIVNGIAIRGALSDDSINELSRFWDSANDISQIATHIASQVGYPKPGLAYLLGLFHNCGIPLLYSRFDNYPEVMKLAYQQQQPEQDVRIVDIENQQLGTNHAVISYYTAKSWNLPPKVCAVIADHHSANRLFKAGKDEISEHKTLLAILKMAEHIGANYRELGGQSEDKEWQLIGDEVLTYLGLGEYDLEQLQDICNEPA